MKKILIAAVMIAALMFAACAPKESKISFLNEDGSLKVEFTGLVGSICEVPDYEKAGYKLSSLEDQNGKKHSINNLKFEENDLSLKPLFEDAMYIITFVDESGKIIQSSQVKEGEMPVLPGDQSKEQTASTVYTFAGWNPEVSAATKDATYTVKFESSPRKYTIKFVSEGKTIKEEQVAYGEKPSCDVVPTKEQTSSKVYTFKSWDKEIKEVTSDETYNALFDEETRKYLIKFVSDGTPIKEDVVAYGETPVAPANPTKEEDSVGKYTFNSWEPAIKAVDGEQTYNAKFDIEYKKVKFASLEGLKISFLGDSISTFYDASSPVNSYYSESGRNYYPMYCPDIKTVDKTWWYQLYNNNQMVLGVNNSWSGSCVSEGGKQFGDELACSDARMNTLDDNGTPDILVVFMGTNDIAAAYPTDTVMSGIKIVAEKALKLGIKQIFFMSLGYSNYEINVPSTTYRDVNRVAYNTALKAYCAENGYGYIALEEYVLKENFDFYLNDNLHYKAEGAKLVALVAEKYIKEYNDIPFTKEIVLKEHEKLPEGVVSQITATAEKGFWTNNGYETNVYLAPSATCESALYSHRIELTKDPSDGLYHITAVHKSGESISAYGGEFVILVSGSNKNYTELLTAMQKVGVGDIAEIDDTLNFPQVISFKKAGSSSGGGDTPTPPTPPTTKTLTKDGHLYGTIFGESGIWSVHKENVFVIAKDSRDATSAYLNFDYFTIKSTGNNTYKVVTCGAHGQSIPTTGDFDFYVLAYGHEADAACASACEWIKSVKVDDVITANQEINKANCDANTLYFSK